MTEIDSPLSDVSRRRFLQLLSGGASAFVFGGTLFGQQVCASIDRSLLFSARNDTEGSHWCVGYQLDGREVFRTQIPLRAHDIVPHPVGNEVLFVARRPGTQCYWLDANTGRILSILEARKDRHFYGHGVFDSQGEYLYLTENDTKDPGRGVVGVYRYRNQQLQFETELSTYGIGPHQLLWIPGTETIAIANGGLRTEADSRENLNIDAMESSLVIINRHGKLLSKDILPEQYSSIRHVAACADGTLVTGQQYMGAVDDSSILIAIKYPGKKLQAFPLDEMQHLDMNQYSASITVQRSLGLMAATAPRGNRVMVWDIATTKNLLDLHFPDCAGIAATDDGFIVSSGQSGCLRLRYREVLKNRWRVSRTASTHGTQRAEIPSGKVFQNFHGDQQMIAENLLLPRGGWDNHMTIWEKVRL